MARHSQSPHHVLKPFSVPSSVFSYKHIQLSPPATPIPHTHPVQYTMQCVHRCRHVFVHVHVLVYTIMGKTLSSLTAIDYTMTAI